MMFLNKNIVDTNFGASYFIVTSALYIILYVSLYSMNIDFVIEFTNVSEPFFRTVCSIVPGFLYRLELIEKAGLNEIVPFMSHIYGMSIVSSALFCIYNILFNRGVFKEKVNNFNKNSIFQTYSLPFLSLLAFVYLVYLRRDILKINDIYDLLLSGHLNNFAAILEFFFLDFSLSIIFISFCLCVYALFARFKNKIK